MAVSGKPGMEKRPVRTVDHATEANMPPQGSDVYDNIARYKNLTPSQRKKKEHDARRIKGTFELTPELKAMVMDAASEMGCPPAHVVQVLLHIAFEEVEKQNIGLDKYAVPSRVPRYEWALKWRKNE